MNYKIKRSGTGDAVHISLELVASCHFNADQLAALCGVCEAVTGSTRRQLQSSKDPGPTVKLDKTYFAIGVVTAAQAERLVEAFAQVADGVPPPICGDQRQFAQTAAPEPQPEPITLGQAPKSDPWRYRG